MTLKQLKIIPLLVVVAMLAFSVRLVEVANGVSTLSSAAMAADKKDEDKKDDHSGDKMAMDDHAEEGAEKDAGEQEAMADKDDAMASDDEDLTWLDSGDNDVDFSDIRMEMFEDMTARRKSLDAREKQLTTREALLQAAEQELERKFQELSTIRMDIENLLGQQSDEEKARIQSLVKIYEGMKAKEAARIFDTLDLDILVTVMSQMSERKLAPVIAAMNPERARTVTIMLAEQKQLPQLP